MGIVKNVNLEKVSGRVGNLVFYSVRGRTYVRSYRKKLRVLSTASQQDAQVKLKRVVMMYQVIMSTVVRQIWKLAAERTKMSGYNLFMSINMRAYDRNGNVVFEKLRFSMGHLAQGDNWQVSQPLPGVVCLSWENRSGMSEGRLQDRLMVVVMYGNGSFYLLQPDVERRAERAELGVDDEDQAVCVYCFFGSVGMDEFSDDWCGQVAEGNLLRDECEATLDVEF